VDVNLRSFRPSDAPALLELSRRVQSREEEQVGTPLWWTQDELDAELAGLDWSPEETLRVIEDDGRPAGFGGIEVEDQALLFGPLVSPRCRGRKFGRTLLAASVELARAKGVEHLVGAVGVRNVGGRLMLERSGFERRGGPVAVYQLIPEAHKPMHDPHPGVTTRAAGPEDVEQVLVLCHEVLARSALSDEAWRRALERGQVRLAEEHGEPVALVRVNPVRRRVYHGVTAAARERGVGGFVLSEALHEYWREHPQDVLRLSVPVENLPASRLYRRQGFAPWLVLQPFELTL
jgi:ribosomal protein S18 acetylase RimI-like enzyme